MGKTDKLLETLRCPVCDAESAPWVDLPTVKLRRCTACDHCFTVLSSIEKKETYGSDYYLETHRNWFEHPNFPLFSILSEELARSDAKSILDIGCGDGAFLRFLADRGSALGLNGIDLSNAAAPDNRIRFFQGSFFAYDFENKFDAIVSLAVIEHLDEVSTFVLRMHQLLKPNGVACIMTLNESGLLYRLANRMRKIGLPFVFARLYDPHHLNHFSIDSLTRLLTKDGLFSVKKIIYHNTPLAAVDVPKSSPLFALIMKVGVGVIFLAGKITRSTYLQTIVVSKVK